MKEHLYGGNDVERFEHVCVLVNYIVVLFLWFAVPLSLLKIIRNFLSNLINVLFLYTICS